MKNVLIRISLVIFPLVQFVAAMSIAKNGYRSNNQGLEIVAFLCVFFSLVLTIITMMEIFNKEAKLGRIFVWQTVIAFIQAVPVYFILT
jgi:cytochrome c biogenesis protein CcdA